MSSEVSIVASKAFQCLSVILCRFGQDSEARLANLAESLLGLQQQLAGQGNTLAELQAAEAELRRLLADKAGLADVQAILQASHAPAFVPVSYALVLSQYA